MEEWLNSILSRIATGSLLPRGYFATVDADAALDARDRDKGFEATWLRLFREVEEHWSISDISQEFQSLAEDIRRESFLAVSLATRQHEIASHVSDDFRLIVRARLLGAEDPLLAKLWGGYDRGEFPTPPL